MRFASNAEAIESLREITGARIIIAKGEKEGILDKIKGWVKEKWTGFKDIDISSSAISMARYNKRKRILEVKWRSDNSVYQYKNVSFKTFEEFVEAPSKGKFINKSIKKKHSYDRIASTTNRRMRIASKLSRANFIGRALAKRSMAESYQKSDPTSCEL
jgi:hypothetical protein